MLIQGSDGVTEGQILMQLWNAKQDDSCTELELRNMELDANVAAALIDVLRQKDVWQTVRLINCHGGAIVNDIILAVCTATHTPIIRTLELHQTISSVDVTTFTAITFGLNYAKHWRHLLLAVRTIDGDAANPMARALARNTWLETLQLSGSVLDPSAIAPLSFGLRLNRTLQHIALDGCQLLDDQMANILMALQDHPCLRSLSLQSNQCHDQGMGAIAALLHYNTALQELDMSYLLRKKKEVKPAVVEEEEEEIVQEEQVEEEGNKTDETEDNGGVEETKEDDTTNEEEPKEEIKSAAEEEPKDRDDEEENKDTQHVRNTTLKHFQLAGNFLNDGFVESLLNIFGQGSALEELNLFGNRISDAGLRLLLRKIPKLQHLKTLWLGHNPFSAEAARALIPLMESNFTLQDVNIRSFDNPALEEIQSELEYYCRLNRGGRRIFAKDKTTVPLSLWPLVMERAHTIHWGGVTSNTLTDLHSHAADAIYCLLHGPAIFENPSIVS